MSTGNLFVRKGAGYESRPANLIKSSGADRLVAVYAWPEIDHASEDVQQGTPVKMGDVVTVASQMVVVQTVAMATAPTLPSDPDTAYVPN